MEMNYVFMTDSDSDLPYHLKAQYDIPVVHMPYALDGKEYFEMKDDGDTLYTLPYPPNDDDKYFYSIVDGLYFNYLKEIAPSSLTQEDMEKGAFFDFEIVDKNTIDVYCYQDGNTYRMYRQERLP